MLPWSCTLFKCPDTQIIWQNPLSNHQQIFDLLKYYWCIANKVGRANQGLAISIHFHPQCWWRLNSIPIDLISKSKELSVSNPPNILQFLLSWLENSNFCKLPLNVTGCYCKVEVSTYWDQRQFSQYLI